MIADNVAPIITSINYNGYNGTSNFNTTSVGYNINAQDDSNTFYGQPLWYLVTATNTPPSLIDPNWSQNFNRTENGLSEATYTRYAWVKDVAGNLSQPATVTFKVDLTPPAKPVITAFPNNRINTTLPTISGSSEANAAISLYEGIYFIGSTNANVSGAWSAQLFFAEGSHTVTATATDAAGNISGSASMTFTVDITAPTTSASASPVIPGSGFYKPGTPLTVTLTANEAGTVYYTTNGADPIPAACSGSCVSGTSPLQVPISATATLKYLSVDLAGNTEAPVKTSAYNYGRITVTGDSGAYNLIGPALNSVSGIGKSVKAKADTFVEDAVMTQPVIVTLQGGYTDNAFTARTPTSTSVISGSLKIRAGTIRAERLVIN
jgi:hypothetical protein